MNNGSGSEDKEARKIVTLEEMPVIVRIPRTATKVEITCEIDFWGNRMNCSKQLTDEDLKKARKDFQELVGDDGYDDVFALVGAEEGEENDHCD